MPTTEETEENNVTIEIEKEKLLLTEGKDDFHFFCHACNFYREVQDVQVMNYMGIDKLCNFLLNLANQDGFDKVNTVVITRDIETVAEDAIRSIQHSMMRAEIPIPQKPFEYTQNSSMKTAFMIVPSPKQKGLTLEDLCLLTVKNDPLMECVDAYLECAKAKGEQHPHIHKNRLYCYLAGKNDHAGLPISHAFMEKVWPPSRSQKISALFFG